MLLKGNFRFIEYLIILGICGCNLHNESNVIFDSKTQRNEYNNISFYINCDSIGYILNCTSFEENYLTYYFNNSNELVEKIVKSSSSIENKYNTFLPLCYNESNLYFSDIGFGKIKSINRFNNNGISSIDTINSTDIISKKNGNKEKLFCYGNKYLISLRVNKVFIYSFSDQLIDSIELDSYHNEIGISGLNINDEIIIQDRESIKIYDIKKKVSQNFRYESLNILKNYKSTIIVYELTDDFIIFSDRKSKIFFLDRNTRTIIWEKEFPEGFIRQQLLPGNQIPFVNSRIKNNLIIVTSTAVYVINNNGSNRTIELHGDKVYSYFIRDNRLFIMSISGKLVNIDFNYLLHSEHIFIR